MAAFTYKYRIPGIVKAPVEIAGKVCHDIIEEDGAVTPKKLVDVSRPEDAPLHKEFEWDDSVAAEEYRKQQARVLIATVVEIISPEVVPTRAFFNIVHKEANYESVRVIIQDEDKRKALLDKAIRELRSFQTKYSTLLELCEVFGAINRLEESA